MSATEKEVSYTATNSYTTLNSLTNRTKNVWFVCHGIGYLSKYFIKYFDELNSEENYIIAPQAQNKYYLGSKYKHVGASWLTKENTVKEIENVMHYFDAVLETENLPSNINLIVLGYSQGVSVVARYVAKRKLKCHQLVFLSGRIPDELKKEDFYFLRDQTKVSFTYGAQDEYLNEELLDKEKKHFDNLFGDKGIVTSFKGKHEVKKEVIANLI